jgi:hypothetical protein
MRDVLRKFVSRYRAVTIRLLVGANVLLLAIAWVLAVYGYIRLPERVASWLSLWKGGQPLVAKSLAFFIYPVGQLIVFFGLLALAKALFLRPSEPGSGPAGTPSDPVKARRVLNLKKEVAYLTLIFVNLVFIHLQSSLTLLSNQAVTGINNYYFVTLFVMIVFILGPYYRVRLKLLQAELRREPSRSRTGTS